MKKEKLLFIKKQWETRIKREKPHHRQYYCREKKVDFRFLRELKKPGKILDIGCFYPTDAISLSQRGFKVVAIDIAEGVIKEAKQIAKRENLKKPIKFLVDDATNLHFKNEKFDAVYDFSTIDHIPLWQKAISEYARVVKKGGKVIIICVNKLQPIAWLELLRQSLNKGNHPRWGHFTPLFPWQLKKELEKNGLLVKKFDSEVMWVPVLPRAFDKFLDNFLARLSKKLIFLKIIGWRFGFLAVKK